MLNKPILYLFLIIRIKKKSKQKIVTKTFLKEEISRVLVRKGGLPRYMVKYIIEDLVSLDLIGKEKRNELYFLKDNPDEIKVKNLLEFV